MKKILLLVATLLCAICMANAQLGNLGRRLGNKVIKKVESSVDKKVDQAIDKQVDKQVDKLFDGDKEKAEQGTPAETTNEESLSSQARSAANAVSTKVEVNWSELDAIVLPESAAPSIKLLPEIDKMCSSLPEIPSLQELTSTTEKQRYAYDEAVDKVAAELDDFEADFDKKYGKQREEIATRAMMKTTGLTDADIARLQDPNLTDAEREQLQAKVYANMLTSPEMQRAVASESGEVGVSAVSGQASAITAREVKFTGLAFGELQNCEAELAPVKTKLGLARSESRIKELETQIAGRRAVTAEALSERNLKEAEWHLNAERILLNENVAMDECNASLYGEKSDWDKIREIMSIGRQIEYMRKVINIYRSIYNYQN